MQQSLLEEIMKPTFKLSELHLFSGVECSPSKSPTKRHMSVVKSLKKQIMDSTFSLFQYTIQEFTSSLKKERVPIQKNILKKIVSQAENECCQMDVPLEIIKKIQQKMIEDHSLLVFALCHISKPIVEFLENHFIDYAEKLQIIVQEINLIHFEPKILELVKQSIRNTMNIDEDSLYEQFLQQSNQQLSNLTFEINDQVCLILKECKGYIENLIIKFREKSIPQILLNKYVILALFEELSLSCYQAIQDLLEFTIFHYAEPDVLELFMRYAIENYDTLTLKNNILSNIQQLEISKKETLDSVFDCLQQCITNKNKLITIYKIEYREQQANQIQGLYLEGEEPQTKYIIYRYDEQYKVIYAPLISRRWAFQKTFVIDQQEKEGFFKRDSNRKSGWGVYPMKYKSFKEMMNSYWLNEQLIEMMTVEKQNQKRRAEGEMDTMFGSFLANVSRSKEFLRNFGESAVSNGCMQQLMVYMPLLKDFLNLGGFGQQALIASQEIYTPQRTFTSTLAVSTSLVSGVILGQALIPIPLVGGIVGGIIGGYLGNKGMNNYTKSRSEKKAQEMVQKLIQNQQQDGNWECSKANLDIIQINFKILNEYLPKNLINDLDKQTKWFNVTIFGLLSLFFNQSENEWQDCLEQLQKYIIIEKIMILDMLDNLKQIVEVIMKNL